jgi:hypothetical protein
VAAAEEPKPVNLTMVDNFTRRVKIHLQREVFVSVTLSFSRIFTHGINTRGPSPDFGM